MGGGGGAYERPWYLNPSAEGAITSGGVGYPPPGNFEKIGYLRQHFCVWKKVCYAKRQVKVKDIR